MQPEGRTAYRQEKNAQGDGFRSWLFEDLGHEGDSRFVEVKNDNLCRARGYLFIEIKEKKDSLVVGPMVPSGIYANTLPLYLQGDREWIWIFPTHVLRNLHATGRYTERDSAPGTSRGFQLPLEDATKFSLLACAPHE